MKNQVHFSTYRGHEMELSLINSRLAINVSPQGAEGVKLSLEAKHCFKTMQAAVRDSRVIVDTLLAEELS